MNSADDCCIYQSVDLPVYLEVQCVSGVQETIYPSHRIGKMSSVTLRLDGDEALK